MAEEPEGELFGDEGQPDREPESEQQPKQRRGRRKDSTGAAARSVRPPAPPNKKQRLSAIEEALTSIFVQGGLVIGNKLPTTSYVLVTNTPPTVQALLRLAEDNPAMLVALEKLTKVEPYSILLGTAVNVGVAAGIDVGRIKPYHPLAVGTGVTNAWMETHPSEIPAMLNEVREKAPYVYDRLVDTIAQMQGEGEEAA